MLADYTCETLLQAWGAYQRAEIREEVGLPGACPSCRDYQSPDWTTPPVPVVSSAEVERACWAMVVMRSRQRYARLHRDLAEHYRDGRKLGWQRLREGRDVFGRIWEEWVHVDEPTNPV